MLFRLMRILYLETALIYSNRSLQFFSNVQNIDMYWLKRYSSAQVIVKSKKYIFYYTGPHVT